MIRMRFRWGAEPASPLVRLDGAHRRDYNGHEGTRCRGGSVKRASIAMLKARLSEYLAAVKAGEEVVVTDRGKAVARLAPVGGVDALDARAARLIRAGIARAPEADLPADFWDLPRPADPEGRSLEILREEREGSW